MIIDVYNIKSTDPEEKLFKVLRIIGACS